MASVSWGSPDQIITVPNERSIYAEEGAFCSRDIRVPSRRLGIYPHHVNHRTAPSNPSSPHRKTGFPDTWPPRADYLHVESYRTHPDSSNRGCPQVRSSPPRRLAGKSRSVATKCSQDSPSQPPTFGGGFFAATLRPLLPVPCVFAGYTWLHFFAVFALIATQTDLK